MVEGVVVEDVQASCSEVIFGTRTLNELCTETVKFQSLTGRNVRIVSARMSSPKTVSLSVIDTDDIAVFTQRIATLGNGTNCLTVIYTCDGDGGSIDVPIRYYGIKQD
jgi:hypothetical protein